MHWKTIMTIFLFTLTVASALAECDLKTYGQTAWGTSPRNNNSASYRNAHFLTTFPQGVTIGAENNLKFTTSIAVQLFLPATGAPGHLSQSAVNPTESSAGILAGETLALALNIGFDDADPGFGPDSNSLKNAKLSSGACSGMTAEQVLAAANSFLGGTAGSFTAQQLQNCTETINKNFENGSLHMMTCENAPVHVNEIVNVHVNQSVNETTNATMNLSVNETQNVDLNQTANVTNPENTTTPDANVSVNITVMSNDTSNIAVMPVTFVQNITLRIAPWYPKGRDYVFFCDQTGFTATSFSWIFGDGEKLLGIHNGNVYHRYKLAGDYTLVCKATNGTVTRETMMYVVVK
jgi:hypothetical protein